MSILTEKLIIGYVAVGPTYRKSVLDKIENHYFDDDNLYYCLITDNKNYFKDVKRKNFIVNEFDDFFQEYPELIKREIIHKTEDKEEYAEKFRKGYIFPFSVYRFLLLQALKLNITNVTLMCTDTKIDFNIFDNKFLNEKNVIYNAVSYWYANKNEHSMDKVYPFIKEKYNIEVDDTFLVLDAAARLYIAEDIGQIERFFNMWESVTQYLYDTDNMKHFKGSYVINDEYILAPIYNSLRMKHKFNHALFDVKHNAKEERFWANYG